MMLKQAAKSAAAFAVHRSGLRSALALGQRLRAGGRRIVVFGYHRVTDDFGTERQRGIESCLISTTTFRRHVAWLKSRFELATMSRAVEVLRRHERGGRDLAVITFDDGYRDVLDHALPVLQSLDAPATLYVSSGVVEREGFFPHDRLYALLRLQQRSASMSARLTSFARETLAPPAKGGMQDTRDLLHDLIRDRTPGELEHLCDELEAAAGRLWSGLPESQRALGWEGVRALQRAGVEIGAHTISHAVLTNVSPQEAQADLAASKAAIEQAIQQPVRHFAYCNGYYNADLVEALAQAGYESAVTTEDRLNILGADPFRIARRVVWEGTARGLAGTSTSLLACQLDGAWRVLGRDASESGVRPSGVSNDVALRRLA